LGQALVHVSEYKDQYKHDDWIDLLDRSGINVVGRVHAQL